MFLIDFIQTVLGIYVLLGGVWLLILIITLVTIYRRHDLYKPEKLFWTVVIILAPILGLIVYLMWGTKQKK